MDNYTFNYYDIQQQVIAFMLHNGIFPYDQNMPISTDGRIRRFRTRDDNSSDKSGAYCIFYEGWPAGWVEDWRNHTGAITWSFPRENLNQEGQYFFDDDKYKKALQVAKKHQREALKLQKEKQVEASENARIRFEQAERATVNHPYLQKKNVPALGLRVMDGKLVVPLRDAELHFMSLQWIDTEGGKKFYPDAPTKGAFYSVGLGFLNSGDPIFIAEGYATMATLYQKTARKPLALAMGMNDITSHEYKHYSAGGTGLSSLLDVYVFLKKFEGELDFEYVAGEIKKLGISEFEVKNRALALSLFGDQELRNENLEILNYIVHSGAYGNLDNSVKNRLKKYGGGTRGKLKYLLVKIFPEREKIKATYPFLCKYKALYPILVIYRLIKALLKKWRKVLREILILLKVKV